MNPILSHALIGVCTLVLGVCIGYSIREQGKFNSQAVLNFSVAAISICALSGILVGISQYRAATECQSEYNTSFIKSIQDRVAATNADRDATRTALDAILDPASTPEKRLSAIQRWRDGLAKDDQIRDSNQLPDTPACALQEK